MLLNRFAFMVLLCTFAFCACGQKNGEQFVNEDATHKTRVIYEKGVCILRERLLKTDTGYAKDGIREEVLDDGKRIVEFYKAGRPDSVLLVYYPSGVLKEKLIRAIFNYVFQKLFCLPPRKSYSQIHGTFLATFWHIFRGQMLCQCGFVFFTNISRKRSIFQKA